MVRNAKLYFASSGKLITIPDYASYLHTIYDPIVVKHAVAFGEEHIEEVGSVHVVGIANMILYTIF
jgi:hypothetical protein